MAAGSVTSVAVTGLQPSTESTFAVFDYNDDNTSGAENYRTQALRAVSNPARDQVRLEGATADVAQLLDLTGRLLRTVNAREPISLQGVTPVIYILRCGTGATRRQVE